MLRKRENVYHTSKSKRGDKKKAISGAIYLWLPSYRSCFIHKEIRNYTSPDRLLARNRRRKQINY